MKSRYIARVCLVLVCGLVADSAALAQTSSPYGCSTKSTTGKISKSADSPGPRTKSAAASTDRSNAIQRIRSQSGLLQSDWKRRGEENAQSDMTAGDTAAATYQVQARVRAIEWSGAPHGVARPSEAALQEQARINGEIARQNAQAAAAIDRQIGEQHAAATAQAADDLEQQLVNQNEHSPGIKLNPVGTNLYVRNYEFHAPPQVVPLRTNVKAILNPVANSQVRAAVSSANKAHQETVKGTPVSLKVHGKVLPRDKTER